MILSQKAKPSAAVLALILMLTVMSGCHRHTWRPEITGVVCDYVTGEPIAGAGIVFLQDSMTLGAYYGNRNLNEGESYTTDPTGRFVIGKIKGRYERRSIYRTDLSWLFEASAGGYEPCTIDLRNHDLGGFAPVFDTIWLLPDTQGVLFDFESQGRVPSSVSESRLATARAYDDLRAYYLNSSPEYVNDCGTLGIGVVNPKRNSFRLMLDAGGHSERTIGDIVTQEYVVPLIFKPGYDLFYLVVSDVTGDLYEVYLNRGTKGFVYREDFDFYTWEEFLASTFSVSARYGYRDPGDEQPLRVYDPESNLRVIGVEGDWLLVREIVDEEGRLSESAEWVEWNKDGKLTVRPVFVI